jgi:hypothetical protein
MPNNYVSKSITYIFIKYYSGDKIKEDGMGRACRTHGKDENAHSILVGKPECKKPFASPKPT